MSDKEPKKTGRGANLPNGPGHGRPKGVPNKVTASAKVALEEAFKGLGGVPALVRWGKKQPGEFYKLWAKLVPADLRVGNPDGSPFTPDTAKRMVGLQADDTDAETTPRAPIGFHTGGE